MTDSAKQLYLASQSPRRQQLLAQIGVRFVPLAAGIDEVRRPREPACDFVRRMALEKARAGLAQAIQAPLPVLGADTEVELDGAVFGKPRDREHGLDMLRRLSGRTHQVISAICVVTADRTIDRLQVSRVRLGPLSDRQIEAYWETGEPRDKAGGYAIQGRAGAFVEHLEGSYSGVMGLPLFETVAALTEAGVFGGSEFLWEDR